MISNILRFATSVLLLTVCLSTAYSQKPGTTTPVPLIATFRDAGDVNCDVTVDPNCADRIRSDNGNPYTDGVAGVAANFDQYGNLIINFQTGSTPQRYVYYDFRSPLKPYGHTPPTQANQASAYMATLQVINTPSYTLIQNMTLGQEQCLRLVMTFTLGGKEWRANFHRNQFSTDSNSTSRSYLFWQCVVCLRRAKNQVRRNRLLA